MLSRFFLSAGVAALLCTAPVLAQDAEKPILKPSQNSEKAGKAAKSPEMPAANRNAGDGMNNDQAADKPKLQEGEAKQAGEGQGDQDPIKRKKRQDAAADNEQGEDGQQPIKRKKQQAEQNQQTEDGEPAIKKRKAESNKADDTTTGTKRRAANVQIEPEKRTVIREKIIIKEVQRVNREDLDIDVSIGVAVPRSIHLYSLPVDVVEIMPEYSDYLYFVLADGSIIIVDPDTLAIVTIIAA